MELRTEVEIAAAPPQVWQVLTDLRAYGEWNPFMVEILGELSVGARLAVTCSLPYGRLLRIQPKVLAVRSEHELRWVSRLWLGGLFDAEHFVLLRATPDGHTRFVNGQNVTGILVQYMGRRLTHVARGLVGMNEALRRRCERGAAQRA